MKVTVLDRQTLKDLAIQVLGSADAAFDLAKVNNLNVTDDLVIGSELIIPTSLFENTDVKNYYLKQNLTPVTAIPLLIEDEKVTIWGFPYSL